MSKFLDRFRYFKQKGETFADGHGQLLETNRDWEDGYRQRWQHDKVVRSTHGVNCTGSCSWKIYVKNGLVTWETADRLSAHPPGYAKPRAARLPARRQLLLVSLQRQPSEISADAQTPDENVA
jgi:nitrate reductase alpha subunit